VIIRRSLLVFLLCLSVRPVSAQIVEAVGPRALGMGGAFVAVANDGTATWWNPGGLAAGPFMDMALARAVTQTDEALPAGRDRVVSYTLGTPPFGFSYYRLRLTDVQPFRPTEQSADDRQDRRAGVPVRSLSVSQLGATLVQAVLPGVHAGTTLKYVRGRALASREDAGRDPSDLLDAGADLEGGDVGHRFDLDVGVVAVGGPIRVGGVVRNVRQPEFGEMRLERQVRVGAAFDGERVNLTPLTVALDADVRTYRSATGDRRVIAVGAEQWLLTRRLGLRAGARFNTAGARERAGTAGVSVSVRSGLYLEAHVVRGGSADEKGWGLASRVSF
jgi:hypothetical protein